MLWEKIAEEHTRLRWFKAVIPAIVIIVGVLALPLTVPILPVDKIVPYERALGIKNARTE